MKLAARYAVLVVLLLAAASLVAAPQDATVRLASLEWPPYTGAQLPEQGTSSAVVRAAFAAAGYRVEIDFFPWSRAVLMARSPDSGYDGYFPEYYAAHLERDFFFSKPIGEGPLGFAHLVNRPLEWNSLDDLAGTRIGVVQDYVNTEEFDRRVAEGRLTVEAVTSDRLNVRKLLRGRLPVIVIDRNVLEYWLRHDEFSRAGAGQIAFNDRLLAVKKLYVCFTRTPRGQQLLQAFNAALERRMPPHP
ncbi:MAG TPA: ABC transporter substrate-binding protein [Gammaproteobacteria bacterium]|nr:ABC transporter substrate-binding protein [Gammaproteobacteria bacterium]